MKITTGTLAKLFNVTSQTIINWGEEGKINVNRAAYGPRLYSVGDVAHFIDENQVAINTMNGYIYKTIFGIEPKPEPKPFLLRVGASYLDGNSDLITIVNHHEDKNIEHFVDNHGKWFSKYGTLINYHLIDGGSLLCLREIAQVQDADYLTKERPSKCLTGSSKSL